MGTLAAALLLPSKLKPDDTPTSLNYSFLHRRRRGTRRNHSMVPVSFEYLVLLWLYLMEYHSSCVCVLQVARLFGPAIFEASKLKVLFLGVDEKHPGKLPRTYTLTHSDITSKLTLAISQTINNSQVHRSSVIGSLPFCSYGCMTTIIITTLVLPLAFLFSWWWSHRRIYSTASAIFIVYFTHPWI